MQTYRRRHKDRHTDEDRHTHVQAENQLDIHIYWKTDKELTYRYANVVIKT